MLDTDIPISTFPFDGSESIATQLPTVVHPTIRPAPEAMHVRASIVVLIGDDAGSVISIEGETLLGRAADCAARIEGIDVSRHHARIRPCGAKYVIEDLGSANGTWVNGVRVEAQILEFGDRIAIGGMNLLLFTHRDELEERLVHHQRMESIGRLAGGIAHDFNNLLGAVFANIDVLEGMDATTELGSRDVADALGDIRTAVHLAADLTSQLLGFAQRGDYAKRPLDLSKIAAEAVRLATRTFGPSIHVEAKVEANLCVVGDRSQIHQVLMNLLINARDSMPDGGALYVRLSESRDASFALNGCARGPSIVLTVRDTGVGMSEETRMRVFEPFFTTKSMGKGLGLGLATAYGIVRNHGGDISVDSTPGEGSTFTVAFPASWSHPEDPTCEFPMPALATEETILLVDDDDLYRRSCRRMLDRSGFRVLEAGSGQDAIRVFEQERERIDVVILDSRMPALSGTDVCRAIAAIDPRVPILVVSGYSEVHEIDAIANEGAAGFLPKPFDSKHLLEAMSRLERKTAR